MRVGLVEPSVVTEAPAVGLAPRDATVEVHGVRLGRRVLRRDGDLDRLAQFLLRRRAGDRDDAVGVRRVRLGPVVAPDERLDDGHVAVDPGEIAAALERRRRLVAGSGPEDLEPEELRRRRLVGVEPEEHNVRTGDRMDRDVGVLLAQSHVMCSLIGGQNSNVRKDPGSG